MPPAPSWDSGRPAAPPWPPTPVPLPPGTTGAFPTDGPLGGPTTAGATGSYPTPAPADAAPRPGTNGAPHGLAGLPTAATGGGPPVPTSPPRGHTRPGGIAAPLLTAGSPQPRMQSPVTRLRYRLARLSPDPYGRRSRASPAVRRRTGLRGQPTPGRVATPPTIGTRSSTPCPSTSSHCPHPTPSGRTTAPARRTGGSARRPTPAPRHPTGAAVGKTRASSRTAPRHGGGAPRTCSAIGMATTRPATVLHAAGGPPTCSPGGMTPAEPPTALRPRGGRRTCSAIGAAPTPSAGRRGRLGPGLSRYEDANDVEAAASGRGNGRQDTDEAGYGTQATRWRAADLLAGSEPAVGDRTRRRRSTEPSERPQVNGHAELRRRAVAADDGTAATPRAGGRLTCWTAAVPAASTPIALPSRRHSRPRPSATVGTTRTARARRPLPVAGCRAARRPRIERRRDR